MNIPILKELERLKTKHATSKVTSAAFQPDEKDQKELIIKNGQRKEEEKRLIELKLKEADVKLKEAAKLKNQDNNTAMQAAAEGEDSLRPDRAQTAPSMISSGKLARSKSFVFAVNERPQTSAGETTGDKSCAFDAVLKSASGHFSEELKLQVDQQARDSKKIFDSLVPHFKTGGVGCQFSVKRDFEVIDINNVVAANHSNNHAAIKLGDINNMKKKDGIALIFDPTIDTGGSVVKIRVYFQKAIDLVSEESCSRDYTFHSNGNYFGLHLTGESACVNPNKTTSDPLAGLRSPNSYSPLPDSSPVAPLSPAAPRSPAASPTMQSGSKRMSPTADHIGNTNSVNNAGFRSISNVQSGSSNASLGSKQKGCSLPGWQGRPPIFIPSMRCSIEIIRSSVVAEATNGADPHTVAASAGGGASTAYNLSRLRIFAVAAPSARAAVKKLHEFCEHYFVSHTANLTVAGGISALNLAALHGNLEV